MDHASAYENLYPYHAEFRALTELRKKPGIGVPLQSGIGGHGLLYLNGVQRDGARRLSLATENPAQHGVGVCVNSHYSNANWIAIEGRDFLWRGALAPDEALTHESYARTQAEAKARGCLDGVTFHASVLAAKPAGMSDEDYKYEASVATDYGMQFGRDSYCARLPLDAPRMEALIAYLNNINAPYIAGEKTYNWKIFTDNCVHITHNALAAAGFWAPWPTHGSPTLAAFRFPVPKNELVDLLHRANDFPLEDSQALYEDQQARAALLTLGTLPTTQGALARKISAITPNELYDVGKLTLIFYDNPVFGPYAPRFKRYFAEPAYTNLQANAARFTARLRAAQKRPRPRSMSHARQKFQEHYEHYIATQLERAA